MKEFNLFKILQNSSKRLNHIRRYSSVPVLRQENVAEHMYWVWLYAIIIWQHMQENGYEVNWERLSKYALLHDLPESQTGDILRITKYHNPQIKELIDQAEKDLFHRSLEWTPQSIIENFKTFTFESKDMSLEWRIIALCDLLSVFSYCIEEYRVWNENMKIIYKEARGYVDNFNSWDYPLLNDLIDSIPKTLTSDILEIDRI